MYAKKVEYLKGLMAGLSLDPNTNEYKLFTAVIEALDAMSDALSDVEEDIDDLEENVDDISDELDAISEVMDAIGDMDEDSVRQFPRVDKDDDDDEEDEGEYEITCPGCGHEFIVDEDTIFKGKASCPSCKEKLTFDIGGCGCGHCHDDDCDHEKEDK